MGKLTPTAEDRADQFDEGALNAVAAGAWVRVRAKTNVSLSGDFTAEIVLERSFDGGVTAVPCTALGEVIVFIAPASELIEEPESGVLYRFRARTFSTGTANWRISR